MSFAGKHDDFDLDDLLEVGRRFGLRGGGRSILERIAAALDRWPEFAGEARLSEEKSEAVRLAFRRHCLP
jgi:hypothetical protein